MDAASPNGNLLESLDQINLWKAIAKVTLPAQEAFFIYGVHPAAAVYIRRLYRKFRRFTKS